MLALAEILALVLLNALIYAAFTRWKVTRRTARSRRRPAKARLSTHYPMHPSPAMHAFECEAAPEPATLVRPAGIDW
jgi:hypothetical protein